MYLGDEDDDDRNQHAIIENDEGEDDQDHQAQQTDEDEEDGETVIALGDEELTGTIEDGKGDTGLIKKLRKEIRERDRELTQLKRSAPADEREPVLGAKPTLEGCDYDGDRLEAELDAWHEQKNKVEEFRRSQEARDAERRREEQARLAIIEEQKRKLNVADYDAAKDVANDHLNDQQKAIIVAGCDNPAAVIYALGKNPGKLAELAAIDNPLQFAFAVAKTEKDIRIMKRKAPPAPEGQIRSSGSLTASSDKELERLEKEADRTGDRSKVIAYKRQKRAA